jgi:DNA-binding response OmpR family regulator
MKFETEGLKGARILLVEDERVVREALRKLFTADSHTVVEANNGAEAFSLFHREKFDLVVTDFEMPFVKGDELAARIRRVAPNQPILMITAFAHRPSIDNPVNVVVNKPFNASRLRSIMNELLSQPGEDSDVATSDSIAVRTA